LTHLTIRDRLTILRDVATRSGIRRNSLNRRPRRTQRKSHTEKIRNHRIQFAFSALSATSCSKCLLNFRLFNLGFPPTVAWQRPQAYSLAQQHSNEAPSERASFDGKGIHRRSLKSKKCYEQEVAESAENTNSIRSISDLSLRIPPSVPSCSNPADFPKRGSRAWRRIGGPAAEAALAHPTIRHRLTIFRDVATGIRRNSLNRRPRRAQRKSHRGKSEIIEFNSHSLRSLRPPVQKAF
jgi:hypothetical protein